MPIGIELSTNSKIKLAFYLAGTALSEKKLIEAINEFSVITLEQQQIISQMEIAINGNLIEKNSGLYYLIPNNSPHLDSSYSYFLNKKQPVSIEEIRFFYSDNFNIQEELEKDSRFINIEKSNKWLLTQWEIINNDVFEYFELSGIETLTFEDVQDLFINVKSSITKLFIPIFDKRFQLCENGVKLQLKNLNSDDGNYDFLFKYKEHITNSSNLLRSSSYFFENERDRIKKSLLDMIDEITLSQLTLEEIDTTSKQFQKFVNKQTSINKILSDLDEINSYAQLLDNIEIQK